MVHFNDVLGVTAFILITSSGGNLSDYLSSGNWKSVLEVRVPYDSLH